MSISKSHNDEAELKRENTETTQDEVQPRQQVPKKIQDQTDPLEILPESEADTSEPQQHITESLLIRKPGKRKLNREQFPLDVDDRLIQLVRCMRCLYDPQHPRHQDTQVRRDLWDIIGKVMDLPGKECEKRWSILKEKLKDIIKNKKKGNWKIKKSLIWYEEYIHIIINQDEKKSLDYPSTRKCSCSMMSNEMDVFLSGLLPTLKSLTPTEQDLAKTQIFDVVNKYKQSPFVEIKEDRDWAE